MKRYLLMLTLLFACASIQLSAADESREDRKAAVTWVKTSLSCKKKLAASAKKVKNEKSAEKFAKDVDKMYEALAVDGKDTAMGKSEGASAPEGESLSEEMEKKAAAMKKLDDALDKEIERIESLEIESENLGSALKKVQKIRDLLG
ncbi:MAG: hypothetical protein R3Y56_01030 [Akkermansia sp.]